jgi:UDP-N-acetylglucosamine--N-acetylmuramyl-(pentapeptide) pyrophosphoryl-undecaprenol N-acetylglucosamine transferase
MTDAPLVLVAGGGTGGHLFPGLAVADRLRDDGLRVAFVGTPRGIEARVVPRAGHPFHVVSAAPVRGRSVTGVVRGLLATLRGIRDARRLIDELRPSVVLGVGGYASVATVIAARLAGVPTVLQEQNAVAGLANRVLGRIATRVCVGFREATVAFPADRVVYTGNPVRERIAALERRRRSDGRLGLLVFGGSQGARRINDAMLGALGVLGHRLERLHVLHQTGDADRERVAAGYHARGVDADVRGFVDDMPAAYAEADLVVARAGAMTCAELTVAGLPSVLVPYPHAAGDHQRHNALALVEGGGAVMIDDAACDGDSLGAELASLVDDEARRHRMAARARAVARPDATRCVADECRSAADTLEAGASLR